MNRRKFLIGGAALIATPALVRATSLMPVRLWRERVETNDGWEIYGSNDDQSYVPAYQDEKYRYFRMQRIVDTRWIKADFNHMIEMKKVEVTGTGPFYQEIAFNPAPGIIFPYDLGLSNH